ncbi:MAG TPA: M1 family aminopeptidase, partial [Thermoanaerobaculia bacterium]
VTLDVASDQVIGSTGVPVEGDPGWADAAAVAGMQPDSQRDAYGAVGAAESLGFLNAAPAAGRKRVRFVAEDVHHFAWTTNPEYIYEGGAHEDVAIHVLYQPGDTAWDDGVAVQRTADAIAFFEDVFGPYVWPQLTNVHRIENGGTEFPMMIMDGNAGVGLIVHETGHQWVHGMLANNEWRHGWLDEGVDDFLTTWYAEEALGVDDIWQRGVQGMGQFEARALAQPLMLASADYRDYQTYGAMTYSKTGIVVYMLREYLGEETFRRGLREFYDRHALEHVRPVDFFDAFEDVSGQDLDWFWQQWFYETDRLDYGIGDVNVEQAGGEYVTTVEVLRLGDAWMPVTLQVGAETVELTSRDRRQLVEVRTAERPTEAEVDPDFRLLDMDRSNNTRAF